MRPVPIPDQLVPDGVERRVFAAPDGDLNNPRIGPAEALIVHTDEGIRLDVLIRVSPEELEQLNVQPFFWLSMYANHMHPFAVSIPTDDERAALP